MSKEEIIAAIRECAKKLGRAPKHSELIQHCSKAKTEYPDCEAWRQVGEERWQRVRIEFEYESRNFVKHFHDAEQCDIIVCWKHNWPECPLEVIELKGRLPRLG